MSGPSWNLSIAFEGFSDPKLARDLEAIKESIQKLNNLSKIFANPIPETDLNPSNEELISQLDQHLELQLGSKVLIYNIMTWCACLLSVESDLDEAQKLEGRVETLWSKVMEHSHSFNLLILHSDDVFFESLMVRELFKPSEFEWRINRKNRDYLLSLKEENLITSLSLNGPAALSNLWTTMTGNMQVLVGSKTMGLASAAGLLRSDSEPKRKEAYLGLKAAWEDRQDICASVLNSLAGWRITENEMRSQISRKTYLTSTLNAGRLQLETLNAMHEAVRKRRSIGQKSDSDPSSNLRKTQT